MKIFDLVFEKTLAEINEKEYIASTFRDNIGLMVKSLQDNDFLSKSVDVKELINKTMSQSNNVKELSLDTSEQSLPPFKIKMSQDSDPDSESFSVVVVNLNEPDNQKRFENSMLETIFDDVVDYIKTSSLQKLSPEAAVDKLPTDQGPAAQPGSTQSELPAV